MTQASMCSIATAWSKANVAFPDTCLWVRDNWSLVKLLLINQLALGDNYGGGNKFRVKTPLQFEHHIILTEPWMEQIEFNLLFQWQIAKAIVMS